MSALPRPPLVDLGADFELDAIRMAIGQSDRLPDGAFLSVNISPQSVIECADDLAQRPRDRRIGRSSSS